MISFGAGSFDMPVEAAVPPGGIDPAALGTPGASPFDSVLEMLIDEIESAGLSLDVESFGAGEGGEPDADAPDSSAVDLAELVNPLAVTPVLTTLPIAPAQVIAKTTDALPTVDAALLHLDAAAIAENIAPAIAPEAATEPLASNELPKSFDQSMAEGATVTTDAPVVTAPVTNTNEPAAEDLAPGAQVEVAVNAGAQAGAPVENQRVKPQPSTRPIKAERARVESPRIDETPMRPFTVNAVDRAYSSSDGDKSRNFDQPRDIARESGSQAIGRPATAAPFVVATETPGLHLGSGAAMAPPVDAPAAIDQAAETHLPQQIVQSIRLQAIDGGGEAVLRLRPEYLGEVVIAVKVEQGAVTAALQADTPAVRQWAERNEAVLRQALAEQGLQLERLTVSGKADAPANEESDRHQPREEEPSQQHSRRRRQQPDDATFEVTV